MRKKNNKYAIGIVLIVSIIGAFWGLDANKEQPIKDNIEDQITSDLVLKVNYLDVGQGDSIFIEFPNKETMLIDAGDSSESETIINYLNEKSVKKIDYLVATHPHVDHIGGMLSIINEFDIGLIYMPRATSTSKTYVNLLQGIANRGFKIKTAIAGVNILKTDDLTVDIVAPNKESYENLNDYSAVLKVTYQERSFIFMGDAESLSEGEITSDVKADVIKIGHHGSNTSTSVAFLDKVNPKYAVISVGADNSYGHPHKVIIDRLTVKNVKIYRTDKNGTITFISDGKKINVSMEKSV